MALQPQILEELKNRLLTEKEELEQNLGRIAKPVNKKTGDYETTFDQLGNDEDENATEVNEYVDNLGVENTLEKRLGEVIEALERMGSGTYGYCQNCGNGNQEIDLERLKANPAAKTCLRCG